MEDKKSIKLTQKLKNLYQHIYKKINQKYTLIFFAMVFISLVFVLTTVLFEVIPTNESNYYTPFLYIYYPDKKIELYSYLLIIPLIFTLFISYIFVIFKREFIDKFFSVISEKTRINYLFILILADTLLSIRIGKGYTYSSIILFSWIILNVLIPVYFLFKEKINAKLSATEKNKKLICGFLVFVTLFYIFDLIYIFYPHINNRLYLIKEIQNVPLTVKYFDKKKANKDVEKGDIFNKNKNQKVELIDDIDFIEKNHIYGYRKIYDIRDKKKMLDGLNCVKVNNPVALKDSLNEIIDKGHIDVNYSTLTEEFYLNGGFANLVFNYFYVDGDKICSINKLSSNDINLLTKDLLSVEKEEFRKIVDNNYYIPDFEKEQKKLNPVFLLKEKDVLQHLDWNSDFYMEGRWWHHHNHILSAIVKLMNNENPNNIFMQYGLGTNILLSKLLSLKNGYNIGDYSHIINSFYWIYYIPFFIILALIFKNPLMILSSWGLVLSCLNKFIYAHYYIAPGANPIRHFSDIFVAFLFYLYLRYNNKFLLLLIYLFCILGIFLYPTYGLFLSMAFVAAMFVKQIGKKSNFEILTNSLFLILAIVSYMTFNIGLKLEMTAYLDGVNVFLATKPILCLIFMIFILSYALILKNIRTDSIYKNMFMFLILYVQGVCLYYITISEITHFLVMAPIYVLTFFIFLKLLFETFNVKEESVKKILVALFVISFLAAAHSFALNIYDKYHFLRKGKFFENYEWNIDSANFTSSMNPKYIEDSVKLLQNPKYAVGNKKVCLISEADNLLLPLAKVSNMFDYIDLQWYLSTPKVYAGLLKQLKTEKPEYIFVDSFLASGKVESMVTLNLNFDSRMFYWLTLRKYHRIKNMENLFKEVQKDYEPVDESYLLTVYKRKNK